MVAQFWLSLVIGGAALLLAVLGAAVLVRVRARRATLAELSPEQRAELANLPPTPLQTRAWWGLLIGVVMTLAIVAVFVSEGVASYHESPAVRLLVLALFLGGVGANVALFFSTRSRAARARLALDERDRSILARAPVVQSTAVLVALAAWAIALTELYWDEGAIPVVFPYLIFGSVFIVHVVSFSAGILLGYWSAPIHGEG